MEHFIPIWQVPSSPRGSSVHSADANDASDAHLLTSQALRQFNRCDSKRSSAERSIEEFNLHDHHIVMGDGGAHGVVSSLYSPEGFALPGFQEYRQQIFTEIQAYTAKGDWNLTATPPENTNVTTHQTWWHQKTQQHQQQQQQQLHQKSRNLYEVSRKGRWAGSQDVDSKTGSIPSATAACSRDAVSQNIARCRSDSDSVVLSSTARVRNGVVDKVIQNAARCCSEAISSDIVASSATARWRDRGENKNQPVDFHWPPGDDTGASPYSPLVSSEATATTTCAANSSVITQQTTGQSESSTGAAVSELIINQGEVKNDEAARCVTMSCSEDNRPENDEAAADEKLQSDSWPSFRSGPAALEACTVGDLHSQQQLASNRPYVDSAPVNRAPLPEALSPPPLTDGDGALSRRMDVATPPGTTPSPVPSGSTRSIISFFWFFLGVFWLFNCLTRIKFLFYCSCCRVVTRFDLFLLNNKTHEDVNETRGRLKLGHLH